MEKVKRKLSPKAQEAWDRLDGKTRKEIQKYNPFRWQRNKRIRELKLQGVTFEVLAEITGMNRASIYRFVKKKSLMTEDQKQEIAKLVETFEALLHMHMYTLPLNP